MGKRKGNWMMTLQEYDLKIKPANIVQGKGHCESSVKEKDKDESQDYKEAKYLD